MTRVNLLNMSNWNYGNTSINCVDCIGLCTNVGPARNVRYIKRKKEDNTKSGRKSTNPNHDILAEQLSVVNGNKCRFRSTSDSKKDFGTS